MEALNYISDLITTIQTSPLRSNVAIEENKGAEIAAIKSDLELLLNKCYQPLKIALIGEVKAGKSTLINALAGGEVSPTDTTEATAAILKISYGKEKSATIHFIDGTKNIGTPEEIFEILRDKQNDQEYFCKCDFVEIILPLPQLMKIDIVDTPGLLTLTEQNSSRTQNYFQKADVVLWVFNGHYLGQSDVNEELEKVADMGKPIIGIVNRIDEIDGDKNRFIKYMKKELGIYLQEVFLLSAKDAFEGVKSGNNELLEQSGYNKLVYYLEHNIERHVDKVQNESLINSAKSIAGRELLLNKAEVTELSGKMFIFNKNNEKMQQESEVIKQRQRYEVQSWFSQEFLANKERALNEIINRMSIMNMKSGEEELRSCLNQYFSEPSIREEITHFLGILDVKVRKDWQTGFDNIQKDVVKDYDNLVKQYNVQTKEILEKLPSAGTSVVTGISEGAIAAGTFGGAIATYAAVLGPAASHISLVSALGATLPPLLFAGVAAGAVMGLVNFRKRKNEYTLQVSMVIDKIRNDVKSRTMPGIINVIDNACELIVNNTREKLAREIFGGKAENDVKSYIQELEKYCLQISSKV